MVTALPLLSCNSNREGSVTLVYPNKVNYESFLIAGHLGYFQEGGYNIRTRTVNSGIFAAEALSLGDANVAAMGDGPTVILLAQGREVSIISRYAKGERMHRLISDTLIKEPGDLAGKRLGVQVGSSTHAALLGWLENSGLSDNVKIVPMDPQNMPEAVLTRQLDAIAGSEPWALNTEKLCGDRVYELVNLYSVKNHYPHLLIATNRTLQNNENALKSIIRALDKANHLIHAYPDSAAAIAARYIGLSTEDEKVVMSRIRWEQGWEEADSASIEETARFFYQSGRISQKPELNRYFNILSAGTAAE